MRLPPDLTASLSVGSAAAARDATHTFSPATDTPALVRRTSVFAIQGIGNAGNIVDLVICLLSFFGALVIILPFLLSKSSRKLRHALIVGLATSDLAASIVVIVSTACLLAGVDLAETTALCSFLGYSLSVSVFAQHLWNLAIALVTYMILVHPLSSFTLTVERRLVWLWPLFWGIAFFAHGIAWIWADYGYVGGYCTLKSDTSFGAVFLFVPRAVVTVLIIVLYTHLFFFLRRTNLFKAVSNVSGSRQRSGSKSSSGQASSPADAGARSGHARLVANGATASGGTVGDGNSFATAPFLAASSDSSTTEGVSGSSSSKRSLRTRFLSAASGKKSGAAANGGGDGEVEVISDAARRTSPRPATIELQEFASSSTLNQRHAAQQMEHESAAAAKRAAAAVQGEDLEDAAREARRAEAGAADFALPGQSTDQDVGWSNLRRGSATRADLPSPIVVVDSPRSSTQNRQSRESLYRSRSASDPPASAPLPSGLATWSGAAETVPSHAADGKCSDGRRVEQSGMSMDGSTLASAQDTATSSAAPQKKFGDGAGADSSRSTKADAARAAPPRGPPRSLGRSRGAAVASKRPSTTETYQKREVRPSRYQETGERREGSSSHAYTVGGRAGRRMLMRRASFGDLSEGSDSDEDLYSFRPMRPRKDVSDFDMTSAPREHLKHLNAPKIWANMGEMLAMEGDEPHAGGEARAEDDAHRAVAIPMPPTAQDFEQTLGDDWSWGMDVTSPGEEPRRERHADRRAAGQTGGSQRSHRLLAHYLHRSEGRASKGSGHRGPSCSGGQVSSDTTASSGSDGQGVDSLGSTLNRQASLLMLLYPAAYVLLFSLSIIRIIDDLANDQGRTRSQEVLHTLSRWFIFAQGLLDAFIFQFIEKQFRKRMKRRRRRAMGEHVDDPFWTKVGRDAARTLRRWLGRGGGDERPSAEAQEMAFRRGAGVTSTSGATSASQHDGGSTSRP
ncbi:uncharacterized protein PFL1_02265 [Pseudozyma flocculosa PF-1]|uniref:G-protein coupled receptors family 1 profile domain-containing protein n=1 Tax=Pseudozyma flocculosa TaxID=84751 RepID=A0A5C3F5Y2_9BASI|nr:uncharacterized protein PFL1_02265 [Pseudozyma flocculosa PF-1]EPQ30148.1 hypothetical protein PFL1_02265 [Pseudozyma flocculosa PF-1]SPO39924.1 uncharacterized protein PSFLO_05405 [Pseudozyma flocculosa]